MQPLAVTGLRTWAVPWVKLERKIERKGFERSWSFDRNSSDVSEEHVASIFRVEE
jgi:hypothetical protein